MTSLTDHAGRWLIRHHHDRPANGLARLIIWSVWCRLSVRAHMGREGFAFEWRVGPYLPLWRERWTERGDGTEPGPADSARAPGDVTAERGALATLAALAEKQPGH